MGMALKLLWSVTWVQRGSHPTIEDGLPDAASGIAAKGRPVDLDDLATICSYITHLIRRFGDWTLNLNAPAAAPAIDLDVDSRVLFAPS